MAFLLTFSGGASATYKDAVRVARSTQLALTGIGAHPLTVDGVPLNDQDRVLLRGQTNAAENGIYVYSVSGADYTLTRALDANNSNEVLPNMLVPVSEGTANADKIFQLSSYQTPPAAPEVGPIVLDTTELTFTDVLIGLANKADRDLANLLPTSINQSLLFADDTSYNIGAAAASRPQTLYVKTAINLASLTASEVLASDASKNVVSSGVATTDMSTSVSDTQAATALSTPSVLVKRDANGESAFDGVSIDGATSGAIKLQAADTTSSYSVKLPAAQGAANAFLENDGSGNLSWTLIPDPLPAYSDDKVLYSTASAAEWRTVGTGSTNAAYPADTVILGRVKPASLVSGTANILLGTGAGEALDVTLSSNIAIGKNALKDMHYDNVSSFGSGIVAIGDSALEKYIYQAGQWWGWIGGVTAIGYQAARNMTGQPGNTSGGTAGSTYIGFQAGYGAANSYGNYNTMIGARAGYALTTANANTAVGGSALVAVTSGGLNTSVGATAGNLITTGQRNTFLGYDADGLVNTTSHAIALGSSAAANSNEFAVGSSSSQINTMLIGRGGADQTVANAVKIQTMRSSGTDTDMSVGTLTLAGAQGTGTGAGGDVIIATAPPAVSSGSSLNAHVERMRVTDDGDVGIGTATPGAKLDVRGSAVFNEDGDPVDFRVEGDTDQNLINVDASNDAVGIGISGAVTEKLEVGGNVLVANHAVITQTLRARDGVNSAQHDILLRGGDGLTGNHDGGDVTIQGGLKNGTGDDGEIIFKVAGAEAAKISRSNNLDLSCGLIVNSAHAQAGTADVITVADDDFYVGVDCSGAAKTVNLPTAVAGKKLVIKDESGDASTNNITVSGTIDGAANYVMAVDYEALTLVSDGTNWFII
jgi:hypothetical protein